MRWGMFKAYLGAEGENLGKREPTLADLIQLVIEGAGGVIDTANWVTALPCEPTFGGGLGCFHHKYL